MTSNKNEFQISKEQALAMVSVLTRLNNNVIGTAYRKHACGCIHVVGIDRNGNQATPVINWDWQGLQGEKILIKECLLSDCGQIVTKGIIWRQSAISALNLNKKRMNIIRQKVWGNERVKPNPKTIEI